MNSIKEKSNNFDDDWSSEERNKSNKLKIKSNESRLKLLNTEDKPLFSGMYNLGNTCYMNAILQCLLHTEDLKNYLDQNEKDLKDYHLEISESFINLYESYFEKKDRDFISPEKFRSTLIKKHTQFDNKDQHDSHELLTLILDALITESKNLFKKREEKQKDKLSQLTSLLNCNEITGESDDESTYGLSNIFYGRLNSLVKCMKCYEKNRSKIEYFSTLGLSIPIEYKLYILFVPITTGFNLKITVSITDNMLLKEIISKISIAIKSKLDFGIFYTVYKNKLQKIYDLNDSVSEITNNESFIFFQESEKQVSEKSIYYAVYFNVYDDDFLDDLSYLEDLFKIKVSSFPRIFAFDPEEKISQISSILSNYCKNFIEKNDYSIIMKSFRNESLQRFECIFCLKYKNISFYCGCMKNFNILIKNVNTQKSLIYKFCLKNLTLELYILLKKKRIKYKELNFCRDFTNKKLLESKIDLYQLINFFTEEEILDDKIICNNCNTPENFTKKLEYVKFPKILIFSLKRFKYNFTNKKGKKTLIVSEKLSYLIDFPIDNLDLSKYSSTAKEKYELYAVCYHHGNINSGHYTTVCKINNNWFEFNDKYIKEYNQEQIVTEDAYILFYKQKRKII